MKLALRELRRQPGRFAVATLILTLIAVLLMFLGGLLDGLEAQSTGALRQQPGDAVVFADGAEGSFVRSRLSPEVRDVVAEVDGVERVGGLGNVQLGARLDGRGPRDLVPVVLFGYEVAPEGLPDGGPKPGQAFADDALRREGVEEGDVLRLGPARTEVEVVGFISDAQYAGQATLWASLDTWRAVLAENRPGGRLDGGAVQALVVQVGGDRSPHELVEAIDEATGGVTDAYTIAGAIDALPGVAQQRSTFQQIIGVTVVIAIVVVALFFALITVERTGLYGVLKALGAGTGSIFAGVLLQAVVVIALASAVGVAAALLLDALLPAGSLPFDALPSRLASSVGALFFAAVVGVAFSLRRVLRVDPAAAIGGAQ